MAVLLVFHPTAVKETTGITAYTTASKVSRILVNCAMLKSSAGETAHSLNESKLNRRAKTPKPIMLTKVPLMKVNKLITELNVAIEKLKRMVGRLEKLHGLSPIETPSRSGRKSMGAEERQQVSARMKKYWADRKRRQR